MTGGRLTTMLNAGLEEADYVFFQNLNAGEETDPYPIIGGQPEHKTVYVGQQGKQQTPTDVTNYDFYVNQGGRLPNLSLANYFTTPVAFTADYACYAGQAPGAWGTVYLPYAAISTDNVQLYEIIPELTDDSSIAIMPCVNLGAYRPGFYHIIGGAFELEGYNVHVAVPPTDASLAAGNFLLTGTLEGQTTNGGYAFSGNSFHLTADNVVINPFEAALTAQGAQPEEVTLNVVDATGIHDINLQDPQGISSPEGFIYNLSGQRIMRIRRGINIINGKKVLK